MILFFENLLIGQMPDAVGLLVFGLAMIGSSLLLRRFVGEDGLVETEEVVKQEARRI